MLKEDNIWVQLFALFVGGIGIWLSHLFGGQVHSPTATSSPNMISHENDQLRIDLTKVLSAHRQSLETSMERLKVSFESTVREMRNEIMQDFKALDDRLRDVEHSIAKIEGREEERHRRGE